ncbi:hypothetical protein GJAV_G00221290 [Gymnothorax javanicus]|nr:hypothetical protein GJAV_G00221290 [Gymnothorax javanicus]
MMQQSYKAEMSYQRRLPTLLLTFILCCLPWLTSGKTFFSHHGIKCAEDCKLHGSEYKCKVIISDGTEKLHYCSPMMNVDYQGNECIGCCETQDNGYYRCKTGSGWGYCGDVIEDSRHYTSKYGTECYDSCEQRQNTDYFWCHRKEGWDYCSPRNNVDYKGNTCKEDYPCDNYGEEYKWCFLGNESRGYCARVEPKAMIHQTYALKDCIDECQYYESGEYFWCHTNDDWDYCSPLKDVTYKDVPCRPDHECGTHGYDYNWCYTTDNNDYDYCGVINPGECMYSSLNRSKRAPEKSQLICKMEDNNKRRETKVKTEVNVEAIAEPNKKLHEEALDLITRWDNQGFADQAKSKLIVSKNLRIDLQTPLNMNDRRYYNLQIQVNRPQNEEESTTLAKIIVPDGTSAEYMRWAFRESLQHRAKVTLEVEDQPISSTCAKRRPK